MFRSIFHRNRGEAENQTENQPEESPATPVKPLSTEEKNWMAHYWPNFQLEAIEAEGYYKNALCWTGKLKPGLYEDTEWEIMAIYEGIGGGNGDRNGAITMYFVNPTAEQIIETLGYRPSCMLSDADGTPVLCNMSPIAPHNTTAAEAIWYAFKVCYTIERMCLGQLPDDTLRDNEYLAHWENENLSQIPNENESSDNTSEAPSGSDNPDGNPQ